MINILYGGGGCSELIAAKLLTGCRFFCSLSFLWKVSKSITRWCCSSQQITKQGILMQEQQAALYECRLCKRVGGCLFPRPVSLSFPIRIVMEAWSNSPASPLSFYHNRGAKPISMYIRHTHRKIYWKENGKISKAQKLHVISLDFFLLFFIFF